MADIGTEQGTVKASSLRGFASMDAAKQREIARKGGRSVPAKKNAAFPATQNLPPRQAAKAVTASLEISGASPAIASSPPRQAARAELVLAN